VAKNHVLGGGFMVFNPAMFRVYAPDPTDFHAAHSIYFQVLGEHGYIGLAIFVSLLASTWHMAYRIMKKIRMHPELKWAADFAAMSQVSMIGYMVGGAFLSLAYYDYFYYVMAALVVTQRIVNRQLAPAVPKNVLGQDMELQPQAALKAGRTHAGA
jgi:probable O-glycosylation ligase (exosortase A-associated)